MMSEKKPVPVEKSIKRKKRRRRAKRILLSILCALLAFFIITTAIGMIGVKSNINKAEQFPAVDIPLKAENVSNGVWNIYSGNKDMKIVQLTDVHIGGGWLSTKKDSMAINAVAAMLSAERPDFVIVTGDIAYPVPFQSGTFNNKTGADVFARLMEDLGIYWTMSFGNHDTEAYSYYSREEITDFYSSGKFPHCLLQAGPEDVDGSGNQVFNICNNDGVIVRSLVLMDSHSYIDGDIFGVLWKYDNMHENQIEWYRETIASVKQKNAETVKALDAAKAKANERYVDSVPSSVFFHIPMTEYRDAWNEYIDNGRQDTEKVHFKYGSAGEKNMGIYSGIHEDELYETMLELGSTDSVFCGHDHLNNFSVVYNGIGLTYGMSVDYLAYIGIYKLGSQRGCTVLDIAADGAINWHAENYYQDKYTSFYAKEPVEMQDLDEVRT